MSMRGRRIRAVIRKELREYRRNRSLVVTMAIFPLIFLIQPIVAVVLLPSAVANALAHQHILLYVLGVPILVPASVAASLVAGERQQGTLEPVLTTPIRGDELLIGKALAVLLPSTVITYLVDAIFVTVVVVFAQPGVAAAILGLPDVIAQVLLTPALGFLATWIGIADLDTDERCPGRAAAHPAGQPAPRIRRLALRVRCRPPDDRPCCLARCRARGARQRRVAPRVAPLRPGAPDRGIALNLRPDRRLPQPSWPFQRAPARDSMSSYVTFCQVTPKRCSAARRRRLVKGGHAGRVGDLRYAPTSADLISCASRQARVAPSVSVGHGSDGRAIPKPWASIG